MFTNIKKKSATTAQKAGGPLAFLASVKVELDLVKWPSWSQTFRLTGIVIIASLIVAAYIGGLDYLFTLLIGNLLN